MAMQALPIIRRPVGVALGVGPWLSCDPFASTEGVEASIILIAPYGIAWSGARRSGLLCSFYDHESA
jgi:hypothetical protein